MMINPQMLQKTPFALGVPALKKENILAEGENVHAGPVTKSPTTGKPEAIAPKLLAGYHGKDPDRFLKYTRAFVLGPDMQEVSGKVASSSSTGTIVITTSVLFTHPQNSPSGADARRSHGHDCYISS